MRLAAIGIVAGIAAALYLTRLLESLLFNVSAYDPATYLSVSALIAIVAFVAGWIPAWRATRIDPAIALRVE
jgi:putative ABC transport system permease protein